jgi:ligand-binding SRPBCC domain-containing protein
MLVRYKVSPLLGIKLNWSSVITSVAWEKYFVDEQAEGPFKTWHHEHHFEARGADETLITDILYYRVPFGPVGKLFHPVLVKSKLREIFLYRQQRIMEIFG